MSVTLTMFSEATAELAESAETSLLSLLCELCGCLSVQYSIVPRSSDPLSAGWASRNPAERSGSGPGVRRMTAKGRPCRRISSGSSVAARSTSAPRRAPRTRTTSKDRTMSDILYSLVGPHPHSQTPSRRGARAYPERNVTTGPSWLARTLARGRDDLTFESSAWLVFALHRSVPMSTRKPTGTVGRRMEALSERVTRRAGSTTAFTCALAVVLLWAALGPTFRFSNTWQLVINTGTTIVTFLMVFLIQRTQNKDSLAIHLKLNEIVAALEGSSNRLIDVEDLTEDEIRTLHEHYKKLSLMAGKDMKLTESHSIEEAEARHNIKHSKHKHKEK